MSRVTSKCEEECLYQVAFFMSRGSAKYLNTWSSVYCAAKIQSNSLVDLHDRISNLVFNVMVLSKAPEFKEASSNQVSSGATKILEIGADQLVGTTLKSVATGISFCIGIDPTAPQVFASNTLKPLAQEAISPYKTSFSKNTVGYMGSIVNHLGLDTVFDYTALGQAEVLVESLDLNDFVEEFKGYVNDSKVANLENYSINPFKVGLFNSITHVVIRISLLTPYILGRVAGWACCLNNGSDFIEDAINHKVHYGQQISFEKIEYKLSIKDITKERYHTHLATGIYGANAVKNGVMNTAKNISQWFTG